MGNTTASNYLYCLNSKNENDEFSRFSSVNLKAYNGSASVKEETNNEGFPLDVIDIKMYEEDENVMRTSTSNGNPTNFCETVKGIYRTSTLDSSSKSKLEELIFKLKVVRIQKFFRKYKQRNFTISSASTLGNISMIFKENQKVRDAPKLYNIAKQNNINLKKFSRSKNSYNLNNVNSESIVFENKSSLENSAIESLNRRSVNVKFLDILSTKSKGKDCQLIKSRYNSSNISYIKSMIKELKLDTAEQEEDEFGIKEYSKSSILVGFFNKSKKLNGLGYYYIKNTKVYLKGQFLNNELNGFGFTQGDKELSYLGEWKKNKKSGYGIELWENGTFYKGQFEDGLKQGIGSYYWENGANYTGEWFQNKMNGFVSN